MSVGPFCFLSKFQISRSRECALFVNLPLQISAFLSFVSECCPIPFLSRFQLSGPMRERYPVEDHVYIYDTKPRTHPAPCVNLMP